MVAYAVRSLNQVFPRHALPLYEVTPFIVIFPELVDSAGGRRCLSGFGGNVIGLVPRGRSDDAMIDSRYGSDDDSEVEQWCFGVANDPSIAFDITAEDCYWECNLGERCGIREILRGVTVDEEKLYSADVFFPEHHIGNRYVWYEISMSVWSFQKTCVMVVMRWRA